MKLTVEMDKTNLGWKKERAATSCIKVRCTMFLQHDLTPYFTAVIITTLDVDHQNRNIKFQGIFCNVVSYINIRDSRGHLASKRNYGL